MEYWRCPRCGGKLIWQSDEMCYEIDDSTYDEDDDAIYTVFTCSECGATVEVYDAPKQEE